MHKNTNNIPILKSLVEYRIAFRMKRERKFKGEMAKWRPSNVRCKIDTVMRSFKHFDYKSQIYTLSNCSFTIVYSPLCSVRQISLHSFCGVVVRSKVITGLSFPLWWETIFWVSEPHHRIDWVLNGAPSSMCPLPCPLVPQTKGPTHRHHNNTLTTSRTRCGNVQKRYTCLVRVAGSEHGTME